MPRRPCIEPGCSCLAVPGKPRCYRHLRDHDRQRGTRQQRGYDRAWEHHSRTSIADHRTAHGDWCPGWTVPSHQINPADWCCDHDIGPLCRSCNARKAATYDKQRRNT